MLVQPCGLTAVSIVIIVAATIAYASEFDRREAMTQDNQLEAWLAQERETQARLDAGAGPGVVQPEQMSAAAGWR
jgi:hypothetical protein